MQRSGQIKYVPSGRQREMEKGSGVSSPGSNSAGGSPVGSDMLHSMLAAAAPEQQKQILGEHLYPHVQKLKVVPVLYILCDSYLRFIF